MRKNSFYNLLRIRLIGWSFILLTILLTGCSIADLFYESPPPPSRNSKELNRQELLQLVNYYRVKGCNCGSTYYPPTKPVVWNDLLTKAAQIHTDDMKKNNYLNHIGSNGSNPGQRINSVGYNWYACSENIARGFSLERDVVEGWIRSESHCKNIMNPIYQEMGIATNDTYWTQLFGTKQKKDNVFLKLFRSRKRSATPQDSTLGVW